MPTTNTLGASRPSGSAPSSASPTSPDIWTRCAASSEGGRPPWTRFAFAPFRIVESQHQTSTRKLVDSDDEQELLESLVDRVKPPDPFPGRKLHYLLGTPFRHPPLRHGSRFGTTEERSIWYGARALSTAWAEVSFYRLLFVSGTGADLGAITMEHTSFRASVSTRRGLDLCAPPFAAFEERLASKTSYEATQPLGRAMRAAGAAAFTFRSARDPAGGVNVGLFVPCFAKPAPFDVRTYRSVTTKVRVEVVRKDLSVARRDRYAFDRDAFEVGGVLPSAGA